MRRFFIAFAIVFGAIGALWLTGIRFQNKDGVSRKSLERAVGNSISATPTADTMHIVQSDSEASDRDDVVKIRQMIEARNVAINFWGTVIDQDGSPLPGVKIVYTYSIYHGNDQGVAWVEPETGRGETTSDDSGLFAITDLKAHDLTIESLTKRGYVHRERWQLAYNYYGEMPEFKFEARRDKPIRITMIQVSATEPLVHVKGAVELRGDGTAERWNLWNGEADPRGELAIIFRADPGVSANPAQVVNWSANLEVVGGEIIEAPWDEEVRRAPESGYVATVVYPKVEQKQGSRRRSFYLRTVDGKYGRIEVDLVTNQDGRSASCYLSADMNPRPGSRNLEPSEEE